jgi:hypothetical protein
MDKEISIIYSEKGKFILQPKLLYKRALVFLKLMTNKSVRKLKKPVFSKGLSHGSLICIFGQNF